MTVGLLIELLKDCNNQAVVYVEGCDCIGLADGTREGTWNEHESDSGKEEAYILITRKK